MTEERVDDMCEAGLSVANRSEGWHTFCGVPLHREGANRLQAQLGGPFPCGTWIKRRMIMDLGPALDLKGSPKDPQLVADV